MQKQGTKDISEKVEVLTLNVGTKNAKDLNVLLNKSPMLTNLSTSMRC